MSPSPVLEHYRKMTKDLIYHCQNWPENRQSCCKPLQHYRVIFFLYFMFIFLYLLYLLYFLTLSSLVRVCCLYFQDNKLLPWPVCPFVCIFFHIFLVDNPMKFFIMQLLDFKTYILGLSWAFCISLGICHILRLCLTHSANYFGS